MNKYIIVEELVGEGPSAIKVMESNLIDVLNERKHLLKQHEYSSPYWNPGFRVDLWIERNGEEIIGSRISGITG